MKAAILGVWLSIQGCVDFKYKEIPLWFSLLGGIIGVGFCVAEERAGIEILCGVMPGVLALGFSWLTKEVIGYGDGIVLVVMGIYLPIREILSLGMMAFSIAGVIALILMTVFKKKGNYRIPFLPFLAVAYWIDYLIRIGEHVV